MPILPEDFDYRYFNGSPIYLQYDKHLVGGETVVAHNLFSAYVGPICLPTLRVSVHCVISGARAKKDAKLDTLVLDTNKTQVVLIWRAKFSISLNETSEDVRISGSVN